MSPTAVAASAKPAGTLGDRRSHRRRLASRPAFWLAVVAVVHTLYPLVVLGLRWPFGADETVYLSQLNGHVRALEFSAPRARGSTLIAAPVTLLTTSVTAVRLWVSALSGLGLWLAFKPWLHLVRARVVPVAAAIFAGLWTVTLYGFEVMPNEWVAFATLGACGLLLRWCADGRRRHLLGVALAMSVVGLLRPSDAAYAVVGLSLPMVFVRRPWRARRAAGTALGAGFVLGVAEWLVEAETSYGGIAARIHAAQAEQGGSGLFWSGGAQARTLAGPLLCRAGCHANAAFVYRVWWVVAGGLLVVAAVAAVARRHEARATVLVPVAAGVVVASQYLFTVPYAAPRFLLPAYALLAIPVVLGARKLVLLTRRRVVRRAVAATLVLALAGNIAIQFRALTQNLKPMTYASSARVAAQAAALSRLGVRGECAVLGAAPDSLQLSYALGCADTPMSAWQVRAEVAGGWQIVYLQRPAPDGVRWRPTALPGSPAHAWLSVDRA